MSYATPADLQKRIAAKILVQLAADAADPAPQLTDGPVIAVMQGWLDAASETINAWIGTRYVTPVVHGTAPVDQYAKLANWEADIAAYNAYSYRGVEDNANPWKTRHDSITSKNDGILAKIAEGTANLVGLPLQGNTTQRPLITGFRSERDHFKAPPLYSSRWPSGEDW